MQIVKQLTACSGFNKGHRNNTPRKTNVKRYPCRVCETLMFVEQVKIVNLYDEITGMEMFLDTIALCEGCKYEVTKRWISNEITFLEAFTTVYEKPGRMIKQLQDEIFNRTARRMDANKKKELALKQAKILQRQTNE